MASAPKTSSPATRPKSGRDRTVVAYRPALAAELQSATDGLLLAQIGYWYGRDPKGQPRLGVKRGGTWWIAKTHEQWGDECGLTRDQARRSIERLRTAGHVHTESHRFAGLRQTYL